MNSYLIALSIVSFVFAGIEFIQHNEFNKKHPDTKCGSGIYGYILLGIALLFKSF